MNSAALKLTDHAVEHALEAGWELVLDLIGSDAPLAATLDAIVGLIEASAPEMLASILLLDEAGKRLRHRASRRLPAGYCAAIDGEAIGPQAGSCGTAAFRGEPVIVADIERDPLWAGYRAVAAAHGLRACWSTPIVDAAGKVRGTFALYFHAPARPQQRHFRLIALATRLAAIAITYDASERERARLTRDLNERVKELTALHEAARLLEGHLPVDRQLLAELAALLPGGWQFPEVCVARITYGAMSAATPGWRESPWKQSAAFAARGGHCGTIEIGYLEERPRAYEGPFLREERKLIESLADMLAARVERSRTEAALRDSESQFRSLFENAGIGMNLVDTQGRVVRCNAALARMLGYSEAELCAMTFSDFTHPDDVRANLELYGALTRGEIEHFQLDKRYLRKDGSIVWGRVTVTLARLEGAAAHFSIGMIEDITARKEAEERVKHLAYFEPLTGLPNRASLQERLAQAVAQARERGSAAALLLMNLDNFRDINNTLGHRNGDALLQQVAANLRTALWQSDMVACLGGDEYAILLARLADKSDIDLVLRKILGALKQAHSVGGIPVNVEASLGIALFPDHGASAGLLWQHADVALRAAKAAHRGHAFYDPELGHYDPRQLALLGELRGAIDRSELVLHYQPKIELATQRAVGLETLVRWQHPRHGLIFPDQFVPAAERTQLINPLTTWVLANALRQGQALARGGLAFDISVNLSARNLHDPDIGDQILEMARSSRFPLERLTVEITESAIMTDPQLARQVLTGLHAAGIRISLDDFGVGQSSLAYLKDLPISSMKIDKSFVMAFAEPRNAAIVRSAIELGHNLGLSVTAEGVEDEGTYHALRALGCDRAQGYYIARPMPADKLPAWFETSGWRVGA